MGYKIKHYELYIENTWLGRIILTSDGSFMSITDYGNFCFHWGRTGVDDFRRFILGLDEDYFAGKMVQGMSYVSYGENIIEAANRFSKKILPLLKEVIKIEIGNNIDF